MPPKPNIIQPAYSEDEERTSSIDIDKMDPSLLEEDQETNIPKFEEQVTCISGVVDESTYLSATHPVVAMDSAEESKSQKLSVAPPMPEPVNHQKSPSYPPQIHAPLSPSQSSVPPVGRQVQQTTSPLFAQQESPIDINATEICQAPNFMLPEVGATFGDFIIEEPLGVGGFGAVFRAKNRMLGREEALKIILPEIANAHEHDKRFIREVDVISRIEHPNVVRLYNYGCEDNGFMWMSMELLKGIRLDKLIQKYGVLSFDESRQILIQLLHGLQEAHRHELIHRDLKPSNIILVEKEGYGTLVTILDFGLAKALGKQEDLKVQALTQMTPQCIFGTPQYMAPEQLQPNGNTGPWSDVYSAALLFVEMMTGKQAVIGDSLVEVAYKQLNADVNYPHAWQGRAIEAVIKRALDKNCTTRYQNADEFLKDLLKITAVDAPLEVLNDEPPEQRVGLSGIYLPAKAPIPQAKQEEVPIAAPKKPLAAWIFACAFVILLLFDILYFVFLR